MQITICKFKCYQPQTFLCLERESLFPSLSNIFLFIRLLHLSLDSPSLFVADPCKELSSAWEVVSEREVDELVRGPCLQWPALYPTEGLIEWFIIGEDSCPGEALKDIPLENPVRGDGGRYAWVGMEAAAKLTKLGCICNRTYWKFLLLTLSIYTQPVIYQTPI